MLPQAGAEPAGVPSARGFRALGQEGGATSEENSIHLLCEKRTGIFVGGLRT
jgi:hypothetical protein